LRIDLEYCESISTESGMRSLARNCTRIGIGVALICVANLCAASYALAQFKDYHGRVDGTWSSPTFSLSQNYPATLPATEMPWKAYNFRTQPREYLYAVLAYILEGNIEVDWRIQDNAKRRWYHVPWMEWDTYGREYVRGLTRERNGNLSELTGVGDPATAKRAQSWAVGFYNPPGGFTIGQVWKDPNNPAKEASQFPEGTVVAKLLFTEFSESDLPFLQGSLTWKAAIHADPTCRRVGPQTDGSDPPNCARTPPKDLRLVQLDVAVKDKSVLPMQWVFGTFAYNGALKNDQSSLLPGGPPWNRLVPVGITWGNDRTLDPQSGSKPTESIPLDTGLYQHLGCGGRLVGPIDNPASACLSCHMQAQFSVSLESLVPAKCEKAANYEYFQNLGPTDVFDRSIAGAVALDFSLQMQYALRAFALAHPSTALLGATSQTRAGLEKSLELLNR
jgi:hypothetical protein